MIPAFAMRGACSRRGIDRSRWRAGLNTILAVVAVAGLSSQNIANAQVHAAPKQLRDVGAPGVVMAWVDEAGNSNITSAGVSSLASSKPVDRHTIFHMASVTKPFVATAIMQLAEAGKIDLDASPVRYIPYLRIDDPRGAEVTIRQMLNHSSGLPDVSDYQWDKPQTDDGALERWVRGLSDIHLVSAPGSAFHYSNFAYDLLADVIAKASGMSFEAYLRQRVLMPMGMRHSSLLLADIDRRRLATPHMADASGTRTSPIFPYNRVHAGSSTLYADAADMLRWAQYWAKPDARLLSGRGIAMMLRPTIGIDRPDRKRWRPMIGLGWFLLTIEGRTIAYHMGQDVGFTTGLMVEPGTGRAVVVMSNIATEDTSDRIFALCLRRMTAMQASSPRAGSFPAANH